jgi:hypothetical protein
MFVAETVLVLSMVCTLPKRRTGVDGEMSDGTPYVVTTAATSSSFQVADGVSLEQTVTDKISEIEGVNDVIITQAGTSYEVNVTMGTFAFETYEKVIGEELALLDKHPDLDFEFHVSFSDQARTADSLINAA